jgi:hypothetical protein
MKLVTTIRIILDDDGKADAEHVEIVARLADGDTLTQVNEKLARCKRPAHAVRRNN